VPAMIVVIPVQAFAGENVALPPVMLANHRAPASYRPQHHGRQFRITLISDPQPRSTPNEFDFHPVASTVW